MDENYDIDEIEKRHTMMLMKWKKDLLNYEMETNQKIKFPKW